MMTKPFTELERSTIDWAIDGHNCAVDDESFHQDNPEDAELDAKTDPSTWPVSDVQDILYRLEIQAPDMSDEPEHQIWARAAKRAAAKIRRGRPDGAELDNGIW